MNDAQSQPQESLPADTGRRRFCRCAIGGMTVASVGTVGYPIATFLSLPKSMTQEESIEVVLNDLNANSAAWGERLGQQIVIIKADDEARVFNGACPHLGCVVKGDGNTRTFICPCHGAVFDDQGEPIAGPVNQPLERVAFTVKDGILKVS